MPVDQARHPINDSLSRRQLVQAGAAGFLGLSMPDVAAWRAAAGDSGSSAKSVIFIYAIGGMSQLETFDLKPQAPAGIRGEFQPIATSSGMHICEHLPMLAKRSHLFSLVRTVSHEQNGHLQGCMLMQSGRSTLPPGFRGPAQRSDWPGITALAGSAAPQRHPFPSSVILPELTWHNRSSLVPGQTAGMMGYAHDPWVVQASPRCLGNGYNTRGSCPDCYEISYTKPHTHEARPVFSAPRLELPSDVDENRLGARVSLLADINRQRQDLEESAAVADLDRYRQQVASLLTDSRTRRAFDIMQSDPAVLDRYGQNKFGWSLLMARQLVDVGVNIVQVNLGHNFTWDTHGSQFPVLKDRLLPPADRAISALLDDLHDSGRLDDVLVVLASEFGRTPKVFVATGAKSPLPGRSHWGPVQTVMFAGGGVHGGRIVGATDNHGGYPVAGRKTPENFAATIYHSLGIPETAAWHDRQGRPHYLYRGQPISELF